MELERVLFSVGVAAGRRPLPGYRCELADLTILSHAQHVHQYAFDVPGQGFHSISDDARDHPGSH